MADLVELFKARERARETYEMCGMVNIYGQTPEDRVKIDLSYKVASRAYLAASAAYDTAVEAAAEITS